MSRHDPKVSLGDTAAFFERLGESADVRLEPGYDQDEVFDDQFERRASEIQRTPGSAVSVIPAKKGPWSGNNQLGIERAFAPDENNRQTILRLDEWDFPQVWSVMLGLRFSDEAWGPSLGAAFSVTAEVEAGVGGAVQEFELDWVQGTTFSLCMNALNIVASYRASVDTPSDLRLVATLSRRKLAGRPPTRSFQATNYALDGSGDLLSDVIRIPAFARSVSILDRSGATPALTNYQQGVQIEFLQNPNVPGNSQGVGVVTGAQLGHFAANGIPIPLFARYVRMRVRSPLAALFADLVFFLGF